MSTPALQVGELLPSLRSGRLWEKRALAPNIAAHAAIKNRKVVGMFSSRNEQRVAGHPPSLLEARIDSHKLRTGFSSREDWNRMTPALGRLSEAPFYIDDTPASSIM